MIWFWSSKARFKCYVSLGTIVVYEFLHHFHNQLSQTFRNFASKRQHLRNYISCCSTMLSSTKFVGLRPLLPILSHLHRVLHAAGIKRRKNEIKVHYDAPVCTVRNVARETRMLVLHMRFFWPLMVIMRLQCTYFSGTFRAYAVEKWYSLMQFGQAFTYPLVLSAFCRGT